MMEAENRKMCKLKLKLKLKIWLYGLIAVLEGCLMIGMVIYAIICCKSL